VSRAQALAVIDEALERIDPAQTGAGGGAVLRKTAMFLRDDVINRGNVAGPRSTSKNG
jgi:hypothetical protein